MARFKYDDIVYVKESASADLRPGSIGWVIGVFTDRNKDHFDWLPPGTIYTIEFEDGSCVDINEIDLNADSNQSTSD
jgi:hypothetical protein